MSTYLITRQCVERADPVALQAVLLDAIDHGATAFVIELDAKDDGETARQGDDARLTRARDQRLAEIENERKFWRQVGFFPRYPNDEASA